MYEVTIKQVEEQPTAVIHAESTPAELGQTFAEILPAAWQGVQEAGATAAGPPFARYFSFSESLVDLEAGLPLAAPITPRGRIEAGTLPGGEVASLWHVGPYDTLRNAYEALERWLAENGRAAAGPVWEIYWTDPGEEPDSAKWRTEIVQPLAPVPG